LTGRHGRLRPELNKLNIPPFIFTPSKAALWCGQNASEETSGDSCLARKEDKREALGNGDKNFSHQYCIKFKHLYCIQRGADKSLARPGRKQVNVSVRMA